MFSDLRFVRTLLYFYVGISIGLGILLVCMSYILVTTVQINDGPELKLIPITQNIKLNK